MSGTIISVPTMSMNAVIMSTTSLLMSVLLVVIEALLNFAQRGGRNGAPDNSGKGDDRKREWNHLDELRRNCLRALQLDLERFGRGEQQTGERRPKRIPTAKDRRGDRDEAAD